MYRYIYNQIRKFGSVRRKVLLFKRWRWASYGTYFDWTNIFDKSNHQVLNNETKIKKKILIATSTGGLINAVSLEGAIAAALSGRGAQVDVLLCDKILPACQECQIMWYPDQEKFIESGPQKDLCLNCFWPAEKLFKSQGCTVHRYSEYIIEEDFKTAKNITNTISFNKTRKYKFENISVGEHAYAGALRFYAIGTLTQNKKTEKVLKRYLEASILTVFAVKRLLETYKYTAAFFNHGIYVPQGLIGEVCRQYKIQVINWNPGYKKKCFIFSHHNTYHHTMMSEPIENWNKIQWNDKLEKQLNIYLKSRWEGTQDWIWFHHEPQFDLKNISNKTGIDFNKPCIGALTSVMWDAVLHYPSNAFKNMVDWMEHTIKYFSNRSDIQLIIRVHPAELRGTLYSNQQMCDEIDKIFPELPANIFVIPPESDISTYALMRQCDSVIIYNTKTGIELSAMGIPVIVAGEAWIRNKGFAFEVEKKSDYKVILDKLPFNNRLNDEKLLLAKKYAYHFFFRRMIPLNIMKPTRGDIPYRVGVNNISELQEGVDRGLDTVCDGILNNQEFIYPAEKYLQ